MSKSESSFWDGLLVGMSGLWTYPERSHLGVTPTDLFGGSKRVKCIDHAAVLQKDREIM